LGNKNLEIEEDIEEYFRNYGNRC